jgi:hypothetical protein
VLSSIAGEARAATALRRLSGARRPLDDSGARRDALPTLPSVALGSPRTFRTREAQPLAQRAAAASRRRAAAHHRLLLPQQFVGRLHDARIALPPTRGWEARRQREQLRCARRRGRRVRSRGHGAALRLLLPLFDKVLRLAERRLGRDRRHVVRVLLLKQPLVERDAPVHVEVKVGLPTDASNSVPARLYRAAARSILRTYQRRLDKVLLLSLERRGELMLVEIAVAIGVGLRRRARDWSGEPALCVWSVAETAGTAHQFEDATLMAQSLYS